MKKAKGKILGISAVILVLGLYYYFALPAINIHSVGFWIFIILLMLGIMVVYIIRKKYTLYEIKESKPTKIMGLVVILVIGVFLIGTLL